jgi:tetratricopeptide (TPR) repeat protein
LRGNLATYSRAAHLLWLTGDSGRAQQLMRMAIEAGGPYPENAAWCRAELALMLFHSGAFLAAEKQAAEALEAAPGNARVLAVVARLQAARGELEAAIRTYERSVAAAPNHEALAALAELYTETGQEAKATESTELVLAFHRGRHAGHRHAEDDPDAAHRHGNTELARFLADHERDLELALAEAQAAWAESKSVTAADTLAWCYHKLGDHLKALEFCGHALRHNTPDASLLFHAGMIHAAAGRRPEARQFLYRALNLNSRFHVRDVSRAAQAYRELAEPREEP